MTVDLFQILTSGLLRVWNEDSSTKFGYSEARYATIVVKKEKVNEWKITKNYCSSHKNSLKPILEVCHTLKRLNH